MGVRTRRAVICPDSGGAQLQSVPVSRSVRPCSAQDVTGSERVCAGQRNGSEPERNERRAPFHVSSEGDCCAARIYPHTRGPRHEGLKGGASQACAGGVGCLSACSAVRERTASRHALALPRWAASHRNRRHSNRRPWVSASGDTGCTRRSERKHRSASFRPADDRRVDT